MKGSPRAHPSVIENGHIIYIHSFSFPILYQASEPLTDRQSPLNITILAKQYTRAHCAYRALSYAILTSPSRNVTALSARHPSEVVSSSIRWPHWLYCLKAGLEVSQRAPIAWMATWGVEQLGEGRMMRGGGELTTTDLFSPSE